MATLQELLAQREELERQISSTQTAERSEVISKVKALMSEYNLSIEDIQKADKPGRKGKSTGEGGSAKGSTVAAKFKDPDTGASWSGRGLQPRWLNAALADGKKIEDFAI
jgi:DNA-binding protein H-NS